MRPEPPADPPPTAFVDPAELAELARKARENSPGAADDRTPGTADRSGDEPPA